MIQISTSILSSNDRINCVKELNNTNTDYIHIDVMDGKFVNNKQFSIKEIKELSIISNKRLDIHLMVNNPMKYIKKINDIYNIQYITFHIETNKNINKIIDKVKKSNIKCGIAINPNTDIKEIEKYIDKIDSILIMSVNPGYGGQKFIKDVVYKIDYLNINYPNINIEVDGGINNETINYVKDKVNIVVSGSYITNSNNFQETINELKN